MKNVIEIISKVDSIDSNKETFQIPRNVLTVWYFELAVQYHVNVIVESALTVKKESAVKAYNKENDKESPDLDLLEKLEDKRALAMKNLKKWQGFVTSWIKNLDLTYPTATCAALSNMFQSDGFAKLFALSITKAKKINGSDIVFNNSAVSMSKNFGNIRRLTFDRDMTDDDAKKCLEEIKLFMQDNFGVTENSDAYKKTNVSKLTMSKVRNEIGSCMTKNASHDTSGKGIKKDWNTPFQIAIECLFVFYQLQGVDTVNKDFAMNIKGDSKISLSGIQTRADKAKTDKSKETK